MGSIVVMGVSGAGKSLIGKALAERLGMSFRDADALHSPANIAKMSSGVPLTDVDRWPWLDAVGSTLSGDSGMVVACSALRRRYRDRIRQHVPATVFVLLSVPEAVLAERLGTRGGHFMPPALLASQLETLETLESDELGLVVDARVAPEELISTVEAGLIRLTLPRS